jgi:hypothetical protein
MRLALSRRIEESEQALVQHGGMREPRKGAALLSANEARLRKEVGKNLKVHRSGAEQVYRPDYQTRKR